MFGTILGPLKIYLLYIRKVLSKVLYGKMMVKSYDKLSPDSSEKIRAAIHPNQLITAPGPPRIVYPNKNNIHEIVAEEDSAFFDIITPPYEPNVRDCNYYQIISEGGDFAELLRIPAPDDFICTSLN